MKELFIKGGLKLLEKSTDQVPETKEETYFNLIREMNQAEQQLRKLPPHDTGAVMDFLTDPDSVFKNINDAVPRESESVANKVERIYSYLLISSGQIDEKVGPNCPIYYTNETIASPDIVPRTTIKLKTGIRAFDIPLVQIGRIRPPVIFNKYPFLPIYLPQNEANQIKEEEMATYTFLEEGVPVSIRHKEVSIGPNIQAESTYESLVIGE